MKLRELIRTSGGSLDYYIKNEVILFGHFHSLLPKFSYYLIPQEHTKRFSKKLKKRQIFLSWGPKPRDIQADYKIDKNAIYVITFKCNTYQDNL